MPGKVRIDDFVKQATSFYIDEEVEREFSTRVQRETNEISRELDGLSSLDGLRTFIKSNPNSLSRITSLLGFSEEKFKRVITMLRIKKHYIPTSDWSLSATREQMLKSDEWMDEICQLFLQGKNLLKYRNTIPGFYLESLYLDEAVLKRLNDRGRIEKLVRDGLEGAYNAAMGSSFAKRVENTIKNSAWKAGYSVDEKQKPQWLSELPGLMVIKNGEPQAIVNYSYNVTTSSGQTSYAKKIARMREDIENHFSITGKRVEIINVLDGAGWIARQSDLRSILECSDQLLNLKMLTDFNF